jgi:ribosomal protein L40E
MKCPKCQAENPEAKRLCRKCGAKLLKPCPKCGSEILPEDEFCGECGHQLSLPAKPTPKELSFDEKLARIQKYLPGGLTEKILAQKGKIEGERKQVTVMFTDMEEFTPLVEKLGPEEDYSDIIFRKLTVDLQDFGLNYLKKGRFYKPKLFN